MLQIRNWPKPPRARAKYNEYICQSFVSFSTSSAAQVLKKCCHAAFLSVELRLQVAFNKNHSAFRPKSQSLAIDLASNFNLSRFGSALFSYLFHFFSALCQQNVVLPSYFVLICNDCLTNWKTWVPMHWSSS